MPDGFILAPPGTALEAGIRLGVAALVGLAVGVEREWSGHSGGVTGHFAGLRTFFMLGLVGGAAGLLTAGGLPILALALVVITGILIAAAFVMAVRRPEAEFDGTTEVAALAVIALGALAGLGQLAIAAAAVAAVVFMLGEKQRLHWMVRQIGEREMRAAVQFAVLALVVLPLLPGAPIAWLGGLAPRDVWALVLLLSAINFAGYLARRAVGAERGYVVTGLLGGLVSSTLITLQFSRRSRDEPGHGAALATGVVAACTVLPVRLALVTVLLSRPVALAAVPYLAAAFVVGLAIAAVALRKPRPGGDESAQPSSPLGLLSAIRMSVLFVFALAAIDWIRGTWGTGGVLATAAVLGLTDMDALTVAMARLGEGGPVALAARGIAVGVIANTSFKLALALVVGRGSFRPRAASGLALMAVAVGVVLIVV